MKTLRSALPLVLVWMLVLGLCLQVYAAGPADKPQPAPQQKQPPARSLPQPDYLPEEARLVLQQKMERHGQDMVELMLSVTLLQYDVARETAHRIASEPRLVRPIAGGEGDVNALLPERFFVLQDEARLRAQAVRAAAAQKDDKALAEAYGRLTETCVSCHSAYLNPPR